MRILVRIVLFALLCMPSWVLADVTKLDIETPLRAVYVIPESNPEVITVALVVLAGEVDFKGPEGLSHYLEHLMFWHADTLGSETMHARGGNAWVNGIVTSYYNDGEASELDDMFEFAKRLLTPPTLETTFMLDERKVVTREYDLRLSENPDWRVWTELRRRLYDNHSVSRSVIGTPDSIMSLTLDHARDFHQEFYHPANAILIVSGDVTEAQVNKLVRKQFSNLAESAEHAQSWRQSVVEGSLDQTQQFKEAQAKSERLIHTSLSRWSGQNDRLQEEYTLGLVQRLFESALAGSLAKPLRLDNFIISGYELILEKALDKQVELVMFAKPDADISLEKASSSIRQAISTQGEQGIPVKSLERLKKRWLQTAQRTSGNEQNTLWRTWQNISLGHEPNTYADHIKRIEAISKADVDSLLAALGATDRQITGFIKGE